MPEATRVEFTNEEMYVAACNMLTFADEWPKLLTEIGHERMMSTAAVLRAQAKDQRIAELEEQLSLTHPETSLNGSEGDADATQVEVLVTEE